MGMSSHVTGFCPPDEEFLAKKRAYEACVDADVSIPDELINYFGETGPDPSGVEIDIKAAVIRYSDEMRDGFEVNLKDLPKSVKVIRFFNSY